MPPRILLHASDTLRRPLEIDDIFFVEADGHDTLIRLRSARRLRDRRRFGQVAALLEPFGFVKIHRNHAVSAARVLLVRRRRGGKDWEVKLEPPVNRILPVARGALRALWRAFGER